ncbi:hypothetical protein F5051DRAFT_170281 [Lentinula edodes]|nr:hypothetical protein F5051DRAFT_170281 [Lentinula edodes]
MFGWLHFFFLSTILQDGALTTAIRAFNTGQFCIDCRSNLASSGASTTSSSLLGSYCSCACTRLSPIELNLSLEKLISHPHQIQHAFSKQITGWCGRRMVISVLVLLVTFSSFSIDLLNFNYGRNP